MLGHTHLALSDIRVGIGIYLCFSCRQCKVKLETTIAIVFKSYHVQEKTIEEYQVENQILSCYKLNINAQVKDSYSFFSLF